MRQVLLCIYIIVRHKTRKLLMAKFGHVIYNVVYDTLEHCLHIRIGLHVVFQNRRKLGVLKVT